jgi:prolipoprotein diacylglyceryltransferase
LVLRRIEQDRGDSLPDTFTAKKVLHHLGDWKIWVYGVMYMCATIAAYAIG